MPGKFHLVDEYLKLGDGGHVWIVKNVVPKSGYTTMFGKPKVGKSYAALQLAAAIGDKKTPDWLSFPVEEHGAVCYFQIDTPRGLWIDRVSDLVSAGVSFENVHFADTEDAPFPFDIMRDDCFAWLASEITRINPVLIVIDVLREAHKQNENDSTGMQQVVTRIKETAPHAAVMLVSHARKDKVDGVVVDPLDEQRGSGYIAGRMDTIIRVSDNSIQLKGRTLADTTIATKQDPDSYMVTLADPFVQDAMRIVATRAHGESDRTLAKKLQGIYPKKDYEACRSCIRRLILKI